MVRVREHSKELEEYMSPQQLKKMHNAQLVRLKGLLPKKVKTPEAPERDPNPFKLPSETVVVQEEDGETIAQRLSTPFAIQNPNTITTPTP